MPQRSALLIHGCARPGAGGSASPYVAGCRGAAGRPRSRGFVGGDWGDADDWKTIASCFQYMEASGRKCALVTRGVEVFAYGRRWQIECAWRYSKSELAMESPRAWTWERHEKWERREKVLLMVALVMHSCSVCWRASGRRYETGCYAPGDIGQENGAARLRLRSTVCVRRSVAFGRPICRRPPH